MAEILTVRDWVEINVSNSVGKGGVNLRDDVLVVQAMLKYALETRPYFKNVNFPEPTGIIDSNTVKLITRYQRYIRRIRGGKVSVDGRIDPSNGDIFVSNKRLQWTIFCLNCDAAEVHMIDNRPGANHVMSICLRYHQVQQMLGEIPVGTLGLTIESSPQKIGTLNLGLE